MKALLPSFSFNHSLLATNYMPHFQGYRTIFPLGHPTVEPSFRRTPESSQIMVVYKSCQSSGCPRIKYGAGPVKYNAEQDFTGQAYQVRHDSMRPSCQPASQNATADRSPQYVNRSLRRNLCPTLDIDRSLHPSVLIRGSCAYQSLSVAEMYFTIQFVLLCSVSRHRWCDGKTRGGQCVLTPVLLLVILMVIIDTVKEV